MRALKRLLFSAVSLLLLAAGMLLGLPDQGYAQLHPGVRSFIPPTNSRSITNPKELIKNSSGLSIRAISPNRRLWSNFFGQANESLPTARSLAKAGQGRQEEV